MKPLSKNNIGLKLSVPILVTFSFLVIGIVLIEEFNLINLVILFSISIIGFLWTCRLYYKSNNVFFDENLLILMNRNQIRKIDLEQIQKIKLTLSDLRIMGFQFYEYRIEFKNETGAHEALRLLISNLNEHLWQFQDLTEKKSPKVIIENHTI